jgi:hypothetical protein
MAPQDRQGLVVVVSVTIVERDTRGPHRQSPRREVGYSLIEWYDVEPRSEPATHLIKPARAHFIGKQGVWRWQNPMEDKHGKPP